ncbi:MAG: hypothetical protein QMC02_00585, partial [Halioglobus sp.]
VTSGEGIPNDLNVGVAEQARAVLAGILLFAILASLAGYISPILVLFLGLVVLVANRDIAVFFNRRGGFLFAFCAVFFHQIYYLYSASAFAWVFLEQNSLNIFRSKSS